MDQSRERMLMEGWKYERGHHHSVAAVAAAVVVHCNRGRSEDVVGRQQHFDLPSATRPSWKQDPGR